jgi:hypothetical protein
MYATLSFFCFGIVLDAFTGFYKKGTVVLNQGLILRKYLKTWFIVDFIAVIPWTEIVESMSEDQKTAKMGKVGKIGKLAKMLRLFRMLRLSRLIKGFSINGMEVEDIIQRLGMLGGVLKLTAGFFFTAHCLACLWGGLGMPSDSFDLPEDSWLDNCVPGGPCERGTLGSPWIRRYGYDVLLTNRERYAYNNKDYYESDDTYDDSYNSGRRLAGKDIALDLGPIYLKSLQWAMASLTTGGSSLDAGTNREMIVAVFAMLLALIFACWFIYSIVQSAWVMMTVTQTKQKNGKMLISFLKAVKVAPSLQARLIQFQKRDDSNHSSWDDAEKCFHLFPPMLQTEFLSSVYRRVLKCHPFFWCLTEDVLEEVLGTLKLRRYEDTTTICKVGSSHDAMGFLLEGEMTIIGGASEDEVDEPGQFQSTIASNPKLYQYAFYGDLFLFSTYPRRSAFKLVAASKCHVLEFSRASLIALCRPSSPVEQGMCQALTRYKEWFRDASRDERGLRCEKCQVGGPGHFYETCQVFGGRRERVDTIHGKSPKAIVGSVGSRFTWGR